MKENLRFTKKKYACGERYRDYFSAVLPLLFSESQTLWSGGELLASV